MVARERKLSVKVALAASNLSFDGLEAELPQAIAYEDLAAWNFQEKFATGNTKLVSVVAVVMVFQKNLAKQLLFSFLKLIDGLSFFLRSILKLFCLREIYNDLAARRVQISHGLFYINFNS